ncbi:MAG: hypothetical protein ABL958_04410 [Bdellovibrionia bacterium]
MKIEAVRDRRDLLLREIGRDQNDLTAAIQDLRSSVSVAAKIRQQPKTWVFGALVAGFLAGELI